MPIRTTINLLKQGYAFVRENDLKTVASAIHSKDAHPVIQFAKYGICGGIATVVHNGIALGLSYTVIPAIDGMQIDGETISDTVRKHNLMINNSIGWIFGNFAAYFTNVIWVFQSGRHSRFVEFLLFSSVSLISFISGIFVIKLLIDIWHVHSLIAQGGFIITAVLVNYVCRKFFIFKS